MSATQLRVLLLCGGRSDEHDVSLASARSVMEAVSGSSRLRVSPLVIGREGRTLSLSESAAVLGLPAPELAEEAAGDDAAAPELAAPSIPQRDGLTGSLAESRGSLTSSSPCSTGPTERTAAYRACSR